MKKLIAFVFAFLICLAVANAAVKDLLTKEKELREKTPIGLNKGLSGKSQFVLKDESSLSVETADWRKDSQYRNREKPKVAVKPKKISAPLLTNRVSTPLSREYQRPDVETAKSKGEIKSKLGNFVEQRKSIRKVTGKR